MLTKPRSDSTEANEALARLVASIAANAKSSGDFSTAVPGLQIHRRNVPTEPLPCIYGFGLAVIAQGCKRVVLADELYDYGPGQSLLTTIDLPVVSSATKASSEIPYLGLSCKFDQSEVIQLAESMNLHPLPPARGFQAITVADIEAPVLDVFTRMLGLLKEPDLIPHLVPILRREMLVRLLLGPNGPALRQLFNAASPCRHITNAIMWLKTNFAHTLRVEELAAMVHMSPTTFRFHFRNFTAMSPLQYQKQLRLQEARLLMLNHNLDASSAGARVGYESASQFSREYARNFGEPPVRDIHRLRHTLNGAYHISAAE